MPLFLLPYYNYSLVADKRSTNKVSHANGMQRNYCLDFWIPLLRCYSYEVYDNNAAFLANAYDVYSLRYGGEFGRYRMNVFGERSMSKYTKFKTLSYVKHAAIRQTTVKN